MCERVKEDYKKFYEIIKVIGQGGYGIVYKGREKVTKELRAIKVISIEKIKENLSFQYEEEELQKQLNLCRIRFLKEFEIMKICSNKNNNSVKCYEYFYNQDNFAIIMELCDQNLEDLCMKRFKNLQKGFDTEEIYEIMNQLNNTFKIMKENYIIHRDLTLSNILIKYNDKEKKKYTIKLAGYSCSKRLKSPTHKSSSFEGTLLYMAPEILKKEEYNYKCDLWSIGVIIYRLIFGQAPYRGENEISLIKNIETFGNKLIKKIENEELDDLVKKLLQKDPSKRINWDEYFNHTFFKSKFESTNLIDDSQNSNSNSSQNKESKNDLLSQLNKEKEKIKHLNELLNEEKNKTKNLSEELKNEKEKTKYLTEELEKEKDINKKLLNECQKLKQTNLDLNDMLKQLKND